VPLYTNIYLSKLVCKCSCVGGLCTNGGTIPNWNLQGVLPPVDPRSKAISKNRSPYKVLLNDFVSQFGTSAHRQSLLSNLLTFRSMLHKIGVINGFQWIDGSFCERVESIRSCDPGDIDVVTFFIAPSGQTQKTLDTSYPQLFDHDYIKDSYHLDTYFFELKESTIGKLISECTYWYSLWSHQRDTLLWKGYLQIDLSPTNDSIAKEILNSTGQGGSP
jgi:hypothetical protein